MFECLFVVRDYPVCIYVHACMCVYDSLYYCGVHSVWIYTLGKFKRELTHEQSKFKNCSECACALSKIISFMEDYVMFDLDNIKIHGRSDSVEDEKRVLGKILGMGTP